MTYRITFTDLFYPADLAETWDGGIFDTADAAIASAKAAIERDLRHFWDETCRTEGVAVPTVETLLARYNAFAAMPIVHGPDRGDIFDGRAYAAIRAAEMVAEPGARPARPPPSEKQPGFWTRLSLRLLDFEPPRLPYWATRPINSRVVFFGFIALCIVVALVRQLLGLH